MCAFQIEPIYLELYLQCIHTYIIYSHKRLSVLAKEPNVRLFSLEVLQRNECSSFFYRCELVPFICVYYILFYFIA